MFNVKTSLAFSCVLGFSTTMFAANISADEQKENERLEKENMKMLAEMGLPLPGSGIKIVPRTELGLSENRLKQAVLDREEIATRGYISKYTLVPKQLLHMRVEAKKQLKLFKAADHSPQYTGLSPSVKNLTLAFKFKGISERTGFKATTKADEITLLGVAPQGGFHEDKGGWSGAGQFFIVKGVGTCSYSVMNVKTSNTAVVLAEEDVKYYVNKKPTINFVEGNPESGFMYKVEWYDDNNFHDLGCASMTYSPDTNVKVIDLAVKLDNN